MMKKYRLDKLCEINSGGTPSRRKKEYYNEGKIPWAKIRDIESSNGTIYDTEEKITIEGLKSIRNKLFPEGSLLISIYGSVGKVAFTGVDMSSNQAILGIRLNKEGENKLSLEYLKYWFEINLESLKNRAVGGILKNISATIVRGLEIPLPSLNDQKRIAQVLSNCEKLIQKRKESIELLEELLKSTFLEMFGDPVRNEKGWEIANIGSLCNIKGGKRVPKGSKLTDIKTSHPYIKAGNIKSGKVTTKNLQYLTNDIYEKIKRYIVKTGDVCLTVVGVNIGDIGIVPRELNGANLTENANKLLINDNNVLNNLYLANFFMSDYVQNQIFNRIRAAGVPKLAIFRIEQILTVLPPITLQNKFATIVEKIESVKQNYQTHLQELENLYGSISQKAFKGELDLSKVEVLESFFYPDLLEDITEVKEKQDGYINKLTDLIEIEKVLNKLLKNNLEKELFSIDEIVKILNSKNINIEVNLIKDYLRNSMAHNRIGQEFSGSTKQVMFKLKK